MRLLLARLYQRLRKRRTSAPATQAPAPARAKAPAAGRTPGALRLVGHQARYELLGLVRNRQARLFTVAQWHRLGRPRRPCLWAAVGLAVALRRFTWVPAAAAA